MAKRTVKLIYVVLMSLTEPGRYWDVSGEFGLFIKVSILSSGRVSRTWGQKISIKGRDKPRELGLGKFPHVGITDAKAKAEANAVLAAKGIDPREYEASIPIFKDYALKCIDNYGLNASNRKQLKKSLTDHCFDFIGDMPLNEITNKNLKFLISLHEKLQPTAVKLSGLLKRIFNDAVFEGKIDSHPIDDSFRAQLPRGNYKAKPQPSLPFNKVPELMAGIDQGRTNADVATRACLQTIVLNGIRPHSAWLAQWREIRWKDIQDESDWDNTGWELVDWDSLGNNTKQIVWFIPGEHMKRGEFFNVPVSRHQLEIFRGMWAARGQGNRDPKLIFASPQHGHISRTVVKKLLHSFEFQSDTPGENPTLHGFRSTFRVWCRKHNVPFDVAKAALSHDTGDQTEISYMRWDLLEPRVTLMQAYADYAMGKLPANWKWIEPEVAAMIEAEKRRADEAERKLELLQAQFGEMKTEFAEMKEMLRAALRLRGAA